MKDNKKRVIVDFKKLTPEILALLVEKYPDGYDDDHIISFRNAKNDLIEAVEVSTGDTNYLVKVSTMLQASMKSYDEDEEEDEDVSSDSSEVIDDVDVNPAIED